MLRLARINNLLLALIVLVNAYIILAPVAPLGWFWWEQHFGHEKTQLQRQIPSKAPPLAKLTPPAAKANSVIIPAMMLDQPIFEGRDTYAILNKGVWHWPASSTPDKGGNMVLIGHRFTYTTPRGVFYFLDKVQVGDEIEVVWNNRRYIYKVAATQVVPPTQTSILAATTEPRLTLYTCTPLWWPKNRLVVTANLETTT